MATPTLAERRLADRHRLRQLLLAAVTVRDLLALWPLLDPARLSDSSRVWVSAASRLIVARRVESSEIASEYASAAARRAGVRLGPVAVLSPSLDAVEVSLRVTGPVRVERAVRLGRPVDDALAVAAQESARAGARHVLNGGRDTVTAAAKQQRGRWYRVTGPGACEFCLMLESRGAVYAPDTVDFRAHDGCGCSVGVLYRI